MTPAVFDQTTVDIVAQAKQAYDFRVTGSVLKFDGHLKFDEEDKRARQAAKEQAASKIADQNGQDSDGEEEAERRLPELSQGEALRLEKLDPQQKFTQPPPRYNEASLVKTLEEKGIGRPSTYASIINTIQDRGYVWKKGAALVPAWIAFSVIGLLEQHFRRLVDYDFTAALEDELDGIAAGRAQRTPWLSKFYFGGEMGPDGSIARAGGL